MRMLTLSSGGWVLVVSGALTLMASLWILWPVLQSGLTSAIGDGVSLESYGFSLEPCVISRDTLVAAGVSKDQIRALDHPGTLDSDDMQAINDGGRNAYLKPGDRVIGVECNGQHRAYPLRWLQWHEVVNDTLGGVPIVVTYHPLCDSSAVFSRHLNGEPLTFGVSGLVWNSNLLMYDRRARPELESLWSQLQGRAVVGPMARGTPARLTPIPAQVVRWDVWRSAYPATTVAAPPVLVEWAATRIRGTRSAPPRLDDRFRREPYNTYFSTDALKFPVAPLPADGVPNKTALVIVSVDGIEHTWRIDELLRLAGDGGIWQTPVGRARLSFSPSAGHPPSVAVRCDPPSALTNLRQAFRFAWLATRESDAPLNSK